MKISHINSVPIFSNKEKNKPVLCSSQNEENIKYSSLPNLHDSMVNIAFCSKSKRGRIKKSFDQDLIYKSKNLPLFAPYAKSRIDIIKELSSKKICFLSYNETLDSKEIILDNLRHTLDKGNLSRIGLRADMPFYIINLMDYPDNYQETLKSLNKILQKAESENKKPILIFEGCRNYFNKIGRPDNFIKASIFKKYPSIFLIEEGYSFLYNGERKNLEAGMNNFENEESKNAIFNEDLFQRTISKISLLEKFEHDMVILPHINKVSASILLKNPRVQKEFICKDKDIKISPVGIDFAIEMGKSLAYNKGDVYNLFMRNNIATSDYAALSETIALLRRAVNFSLLMNPDVKCIDDVDIANSFPHDLPWQNLYRIFDNNRNMARLLMTNSAMSEDEEERLKEEIDKMTAAKSKDSETEESLDDTNSQKITFADIGGMYNIKKQLKEEFLDIIKNPNVKNSQKPSGIMLSGPPGCGKTLLAKAIAGEAKVPFFSIAGSSFVEVYVGVGPKRVRELYKQAREAAQNHPSKTAIVFIDEVDAVAGSRKNRNVNNEDLRTVNALLHEMDGAGNKNDDGIKIITIVATNHEDMLDDAFKRSGRIDLKYTIDDPRYSTKARAEIIKIHSRDLKFQSAEEKNYILNELAKSSAGMSGADLAELLKKADRMSMRIGREENYVTRQDIAEAKMQVLAGVKTDIEHTEYELRQTAARTAGYALNAMVLQKVFESEKNKHKVPLKVLDFITNSARGKSLGSVYFKPSAENKSKSKETCLADIIMLYGGYATEYALFDTHSSAINEDLRAATEIIEDAVSGSDFGSQKHYLSLTSNLTRSLFAQEIKDDMSAFSQKGMEISKTIINFARDFIENYVEDIIDSGEYDETISAEEFKDKFNDWLNANNKQEEYAKLCQNIRGAIDEFCSEKEKNRLRLGFNQ